MSQYTLANPRHYILEVLDINDDRIGLFKQFRTPKQMDEYAIAYFYNHPEAYRIQLWRGGADVDNPNIDTDWVNSYCREPFEEFGQTSIAVKRSNKVTRITNKGKFIEIVDLPTVYSLGGNWHRVTIKKGAKKAKKRLNLEAIAG